MTHYKFRTRVVTTLAALTFPALALAQGSGSSSQGSSSPAPGNADQSSSAQGSSNQGSSNQGSSTARDHQGSNAQGRPAQAPQAGQTQGSSSTRQGATGTQGRAGDSMSATDPSMGSMNAGGNAQGMIDPTQIQKVFGTDATLVDLKSLGTDETRRLQQSLKDRGLYQGTVDGVFGPQTRAALSALISQQYALNQRLINQGQITGPVATSIGLDTQGVAPVSGTDLSAPRQQPMPPSNSGQPQRQQPQPNRNSPTYPQAPATGGESDMQPAPQNPR
jgi:putative peptidoglycan binding protein